MKHLKNFTKHGSIYKLKPQTFYKISLSILLLLLAVFSWFIEIPMLAYIFGLLVIMVLVTTVTDKFEIDTNQKYVTSKSGLIMPAYIIPFDKISHFEMETTTSFFIKSFVALNLYYFNENGKQKAVKIVQGISKNQLQRILNEIDIILLKK